MSEKIPERTDWSNPWVIAVGLLPWVLLLFMVPVFWILLPPVLVFLVVMYVVFARSMKKARKLAGQRLAPGAQSELDVEFSPGMTAALVMNDWGIVFVRFARRSVELAWSDIDRVEEPAIAKLAIRAHGAVACEVDLSQDRYFLAIQFIHSKIPDKTDFDVDPLSGQSRLLTKIELTPMAWQGSWGKLVMTPAGIEHDAHAVSWQEIDSVQEVSHPGDESENWWELKCSAGAASFVLKSSDFTDGRPLGNSDYDAVKAVLAERIPGKTSFDRPAPVPFERAKEELRRCLDAYPAGFSLALKNGRFQFLESRFRHMLMLVDQFSLDRTLDVRPFFRDYAELLSRTNHLEEAARLHQRAMA